MSIAAVSANGFYQSQQSLFSAPKRAQDPFTLPDQAPIPGHTRDSDVQRAGAQPAALQGNPLFNVLAGSSGSTLNGQPEFNVLAAPSVPALQGQPTFNVLSQSLPEL